jgi:hypothetical protein
MVYDHITPFFFEVFSDEPAMTMMAQLMTESGPSDSSSCLFVA